MSKIMIWLARSNGMVFIFNTTVLFMEPFRSFGIGDRIGFSIVFVIGFYLINASFIWREK